MNVLGIRIPRVADQFLEHVLSRRVLLAQQAGQSPIDLKAYSLCSHTLLPLVSQLLRVPFDPYLTKHDIDASLINILFMPLVVHALWHRG